MWYPPACREATAALQKRSASIKKLVRNAQNSLRKRIKIMYKNAKTELYENA